jgi:hypothetical protein
MFGFGFWKGNRSVFVKYQEIYNPLKDRLKEQWDNDIFLDSIMAKDPMGEEGILYSKDGIAYNLYQLEKAIKFKRPAWVFFYLIGHLFGEVVDGEFTIEDFKVYLEKFPRSFKIEHGEKLVLLVNYFGQEHSILLKFINDNVELDRDRMN